MKKVLGILLAMCLLLLSIPFAAQAASTERAVKLAKPVLEILNEPSNGKNWRLGDDINFRLRFQWPREDESIGEGWNPDEIRYCVYFDGKQTEQWWHGWWYDEESENYYGNDNWFTINKTGTMTIEVFINWHHWWNEGDEWIESEHDTQKFTINKGATFGKVNIYTENEPAEGKALRIGFTVPRKPDWEDPSFRTDNDICVPYVQYTVTNKSTGKRVDIAPRKASYHEAGMGPWEWWDDQAQEQIYVFGTSVVITNELEKGTYEVEAKVVDKAKNHGNGASNKLVIKVGEPASGVNINFDKASYEVGDKATITVDAEDARSFRIHIIAPYDGGDWEDVVKAKNGAYKFTTKELTWQSDIRVEVYQVDGFDLENIAYSTAQVFTRTHITADKKDYNVGDTAKLTLSAYKPDQFGVEVTIHRADGTTEYRQNEYLTADKSGKAVYEIDLEEPETVFLRVWAESFERGYEDVRYAIEVLDEDEKPINLKAPKGLSLKNSSNNIALSWKAVDNAQQYLVYRRTGDEDYEEPIAQVKGTSYVDKKAEEGTLYAYRVTAYAVNKNGVEYESPASAEKYFVILGKVKDVTAVSKSSKTMIASWKAVDGAGAYEIYYSTAKKAPKASTPGLKTSSDLTVMVDGLTAGKTYYVYVRAIKNLDSGSTIYGPWSSKATVKIIK